MYESVDFSNFVYRTYCRKSSDAEDRQVQSLDRQEEELRLLQQRYQLTVLNDEYLKESESAFTPGRPVFNQLVKDTETALCSAWFVWHANRLSRNALDSGVIIQLMDDGKLHHIRTSSRIYWNTPEDKWMLQLEFANSKKDSDDKSKFVKSGLRERYRKGLPSGIASIGYLNDTSMEKGNRKWVVDRKRFPLVVKILEEYLTGHHSVSSITKYARDVLCLTTPKRRRMGGKLVSRSYVHRNILTNPIYAGFFYANGEDGERKRYELDSSLPRPISEDEHHRIKLILGERTVSRRQSHEGAYTGVLRSAFEGGIGQDFTFQVICDCKHKFAYLNKETCPSCGIEIHLMQQPTYLSYIYYYNVRRRRTKGVVARTIEERKVDQFLLEYLHRHFHLSPPLITWGKAYLKELEDHSIEEQHIAHVAREDRRQEITMRKKRLREMYLTNMVTRTEYMSDLKELDLELSRISLNSGDRDWFEKASSILDLTGQAVDVIQNGTSSRKRGFFSELGSNLIWDEQNLRIINTEPVQALMNAIERTQQENPQFEPSKVADLSCRNTVFESVRPILLRGLDDVRTFLLEVYT